MFEYARTGTPVATLARRMHICYSAITSQTRESRKMQSCKLLILTVSLLALFSVPLSAADKNKTSAGSLDVSKPSYELPQPAKENLDFTMYERIRIEG